MKEQSRYKSDIPMDWTTTTAPSEQPQFHEWIVGQVCGVQNLVYVTHLRHPCFCARVIYTDKGVKIGFVYPDPADRMTTVEENPWTYLVLREVSKMTDYIEAQMRAMNEETNRTLGGGQS